jgi:hypothetical protein
VGATNGLDPNKAIDRLPRQSNASVEQVLVNARRLGMMTLAQACQDELRTRGGSLTLTKEDAEQAASVSSRIYGKPLSEVIQIAFTEVPPKPEELLIIRWIWKNPGTSYAEIEKVYTNGDLSLVIGHMVYYRFGYFRSLLASPIQSDLLLERGKIPGGRVCYTLRPEAIDAFTALWGEERLG